MRESLAARIGVHTAWSCRIPACRLGIALSVLTLVALCPLPTLAADPNINTARFSPPTAIPTPVPTPTDAPTPTQTTPTTAPTPTPTQPPPTPSATASPTPTSTPTVTPTVAPTSLSGPTAGMKQVGDGNAAFYSADFDNGGWDKIIQARLRSGQGDPKTFAFSPDGFYCVHPDFAFGDVLVLQNVTTGKTVRCTIADSIAPSEETVWRSHWVIETSYALFSALGLDRTNHVTVWTAPKP